MLCVSLTIDFIFSFIDDLQKAHQKLKKCELLSDVQSGVSEVEHSRHRKKNPKYFSSSDEENNNISTKSVLRRPPKIIKDGNFITHFYK